MAICQDRAKVCFKQQNMVFNFPTLSYNQFLMNSVQKEAQLLLALQAIKKDPKFSIRRAANIYTISRLILAMRIDGIRARRNIVHLYQKLTKLEENTIVQRIIELNFQALPPRLSAVEDMVNRLLCDRDASRVGKNWAFNFVKRQS
jgi:hypothetical protein